MRSYLPKIRGGNTERERSWHGYEEWASAVMVMLNNVYDGSDSWNSALCVRCAAEMLHFETLPMFLILVSICFSFSRMSTWHQPAETVEKESIWLDKWHGISGNSAVFLVRSLHFIFQIINVNVIRMQSITHFNVFANSAEPTRLLLGKTLRAHDAARGNEDGLRDEPDALLLSACVGPHQRTDPHQSPIHIRAWSSQLWLLLSSQTLLQSHLWPAECQKREFEKHHHPTGCHLSPSHTASLPAAMATA